MSIDTLIALANNIRNEHSETQAWASSPFNWIRTLSPGTKGSVGRKLATGLLQEYGHTIATRKSVLRVNSLDLKVKTSLMWDADIIKFQNIRDTPFDYALCLGICPHEAFGWLVPKDQIWDNGKIRIDQHGISAQHKGADAWLSVKLASVQDWIKPYGGTIDDLIKVAKTSL